MQVLNVTVPSAVMPCWTMLIGLSQSVRIHEWLVFSSHLMLSIFTARSHYQVLDLKLYYRLWSSLNRIELLLGFLHCYLVVFDGYSEKSSIIFYHFSLITKESYTRFPSIPTIVNQPASLPMTLVMPVIFYELFTATNNIYSSHLLIVKHTSQSNPKDSGLFICLWVRSGLNSNF